MGMASGAAPRDFGNPGHGHIASGKLGLLQGVRLTAACWAMATPANAKAATDSPIRIFLVIFFSL